MGEKGIWGKRQGTRTFMHLLDRVRGVGNTTRKRCSTGILPPYASYLDVALISPQIPLEKTKRSPDPSRLGEGIPVPFLTPSMSALSTSWCLRRFFLAPSPRKKLTSTTAVIGSAVSFSE